MAKNNPATAGAKRLMGALLRMPPKPHHRIMLGRKTSDADAKASRGIRSIPLHPSPSGALSRPLKVSGVAEIWTLADVRRLLDCLPRKTHAKPKWRSVERAFKKAAAGAHTARVSDK